MQLHCAPCSLQQGRPSAAHRARQAWFTVDGSEVPLPPASPAQPRTTFTPLRAHETADGRVHIQAVATNDTGGALCMHLAGTVPRGLCDAEALVADVPAGQSALLTCSVRAHGAEHIDILACIGSEQSGCCCDQIPH